MLSAVGQGLGALLLAFVLAAACCIVAWVVFYACTIAAHNKHGKPQKFKSVLQDYLVDVALLRLGTTFLQLLLTPVQWAFRTASAIIQYALSHWKLILLSSLIVWAGTGVTDHTQEVLQAIDYSYTHYLAGALNVLKQFANAFRVLLDLATPLWNLFFYVMRRVPIDTLEASIECAGPFLKLTFTELGHFIMDVVQAINQFILRPGVPLNLVDAFYDLQQWAEGIVKLVGCYCRDLEDPAQVLANAVTTPSTAWALSNLTATPFNLLVTVAANATGPPATRPSFDVVFDGVISVILSWSGTFDAFLNGIAGLLLIDDAVPTCEKVLGTGECTFNSSDPHFGCNGAANCQDHPDCFFDGRSQCIWYYTPHSSGYVVGRTPKIHRTIPLPFTQKSFTVNIPARFFHFVSYGATAWLEGAKVLLRTLINIDKLKIAGTEASEKAALWNADKVFDYWRLSNAFLFDLSSYFLNHDSVPSFIRYTPDVLAEIINRWIDLFQFIYAVSVNLIVGVIDKAEGVITWREFFGAFLYDWRTLVVEPALGLCELTGKWGGNEDNVIYPVGCVLQTACTTGVQLINNTFYLIGYASQGGGSCIKQMENGSFVSSDSCWSPEDGTLMFNPFIEAAYNFSDCLPNLLNSWQGMDTKEQGWQNADSEENCIWRDSITPPVCTPGNCKPDAAHIAQLTHASLEIYPQVCSRHCHLGHDTNMKCAPQGRFSDWWSRRCINSTLCIEMEHSKRYADWTRSLQQASAVMQTFNQTCTVNPATCDLHNVGQSGFFCRNVDECCGDCDGIGNGIQCSLNDLDAPCHANCPIKSRHPPHAHCRSCGKPYDSDFSPLQGSGWSLVPGAGFDDWTGCVCDECVQAAQQALPFELWECVWLNPSEVLARFGTDPEKFKLCSLAAACNLSPQQPSGLYDVHAALETQCESFVQVGLDSCVGCDVNLKLPLCNFGSSLSATWRAAVLAVVAALNGIVTTIAESVYDKTFYISWPHQTMNGIICAFKDVTGSLISILTSVLYDVCLLFVDVTPSSIADFEHPSVPVALIRFSSSPDPISPQEFFDNVANKPKFINLTSWNGTFQWATPSNLLDAFPVGIYGSSIRDGNKWARIGGDFCCEYIDGKCVEPSNSYACPIQFNSAHARYLCANGDQDSCFHIENPTLPICWGVSSSKPYVCATHEKPIGSDLQTLTRVEVEKAGQVLLHNAPQVYEHWILPFLSNTNYAAFFRGLKSLKPLTPNAGWCSVPVELELTSFFPDCDTVSAPIDCCQTSDECPDGTFSMGVEGTKACTAQPAQACRYGKEASDVCRGCTGDEDQCVVESNNNCAGCATMSEPCASSCNRFVMNNEFLTSNNLVCVEGESCGAFESFTCGGLDSCIGESCVVKVCCGGKWVLESNYKGLASCFGDGVSLSTWTHEMGADGYWNNTDDWEVDAYDYAYVDTNDNETACTADDVSTCYASGAWCRLTGATKEKYMSVLWSTAGAVDPDTYLNFDLPVINPELSKYYEDYIVPRQNLVNIKFQPSEACKKIMGDDPFPELKRNTSKLFTGSNACAYPDIVIPCSLCGHPPAFASKCLGNDYGNTGCSKTSFQFYADSVPPYQNNLSTAFFDSLYDTCDNSCSNVITDAAECALKCKNQTDTATCGVCNKVWATRDECRDLCTNKLPGAGAANNWTKRIRCGTTESDVRMGRYDTSTYDKDEWHSGCTCQFLPDFDRIAEPFKLSQATIQAQENAWIKFKSFEVMETFAATNPKRVKYLSAAGGYSYTNDASSGAPLNTLYQTEGGWREVHALENLRFMSDVILNAGLGWVYIVEAGISTLRYMVDLFNAVISPQYGTYVCDIGAIGGGKNAQNPQGDKIENNQPRLKGRIQQIVQCIGATIFQIVGNAVDTIYAYTIGLFQSLQVLVRYWSVGQWRLNLPYPLFGENVADWNYPIQSHLAKDNGVGIEKPLGYCTEFSLFNNANPRKPLCSIGNGVYDVGSEIWSGLYDEVGDKIMYNLTGTNGCACECLKTAACSFDDYLVISCAHCIIEDMVDELVETQWIVDSILQLIYWLMQVILDALQYVFGAGSLADLEYALQQFVQHLVAFLGVVGKVVYEVLLQIPVFGPVLKYIVEELVCEIVIKLIINDFLVKTFHDVCTEIEDICNHLTFLGVPKNCSWAAGACDFQPATLCKTESNPFEGEMRPAPLATGCASSWLYNGYDACRGSDVRPSEATCVSAGGELVFCECNPEIGVDICCNTSHLYIPDVSEWSGQCDSISQECVCANTARPDNNPQHRLFATCGENKTSGWNDPKSECHSESGFCRVYSSVSYSADLEAVPRPCSVCDDPRYLRFCEASTGFCACRVLPTDTSCLSVGAACHQAQREPSALYWLGQNATQDFPINAWSASNLELLRIGPYPPLSASGAVAMCVDFGSGVMDGENTFCVFTVTEQTLQDYTAAYSYDPTVTLQYVYNVLTNFTLHVDSVFINLNTHSMQIRGCLALPCNEANNSCFGGLLYASGWTGSNAQAMIFDCDGTTCTESGAIGGTFSTAPIVYANNLNVGLASEWVCGTTSFTPTATTLHAVCVDGCTECYPAQQSVGSLCSEHNQILNGTLYDGSVPEQYGYVYSFDGVITSGTVCSTDSLGCGQCNDPPQKLTYLCVDKNYVPDTPSVVPACTAVNTSGFTNDELWFAGVDMYTLYANYSGEPGGTLDTQQLYLLWSNAPANSLLWLYQNQLSNDCTSGCSAIGFVCSATAEHVTVVSDDRFLNTFPVFAAYASWDETSGLNPVAPSLSAFQQSYGMSNAVVVGCPHATYEQPCVEATCLTQCIRPEPANDKPQHYQISFVCDVNATQCVQCINGQYGYLNTSLRQCTDINPESRAWDTIGECKTTWQCFPRFSCNETSQQCDPIPPAKFANEDKPRTYYSNLTTCDQKCGLCASGEEKPNKDNGWGCPTFDQSGDVPQEYPNGTAYCLATFEQKPCVIYKYAGVADAIYYYDSDIGTDVVQYASSLTPVTNTICSVVLQGNNGQCNDGYSVRCVMDELVNENAVGQPPDPELACYCECPSGSSSGGRRRQLLQVEETSVQMPQVLDATACRDDSDCWRHAPPSVCNYKTMNRFCDSCPRVLGTVRNRTCTDGYCACKPAEWTDALMQQTAVDAFGNNIDMFTGDALCDAIMHSTPETEQEKLLQIMCQRSVQKAAIFKQRVGLAVPLNIFYDPTSIFSYLSDTIYGLYMLNANAESSVYEQWSMLAKANIDPVRLLNLQDSILKGQSWIAQQSGSIFSNGVNKLRNAAETATKTIDRKFNLRTSKVLDRTWKLVSRNVANPVRNSALTATAHMVHNKVTTLKKLHSEVKPHRPPPQHKKQSTSSALVQHPSPARISTGTPTRQIRWIFPAPRELHVSPNSSCFVVEFMAKDIWVAVESTILYYERVFPNVISRFDAEIQALPTLPPVNPAQQDVIAGCTPTREVDDLWSGFLFAAEFIGQPLCVTGQFFRNVVKQSKAGNITQVEDLLEGAFGCDIYSIQTCKTRRNFIYALGIWFGLFGALTVLVSIWAPFLLTPIIGLTLLWLLLFAWWTYAIAPNCLPLVSTCLWDDLFDFFSRMTPYPSIPWDAACWKEPDGQFINCSKYYNSGYDSVGFALQRWAPAFAERMLNGSQWEKTVNWIVGLDEPLKSFPQNTSLSCQAQTCFWLSSIYLIPFVSGGGLVGLVTSRSVLLVVMLLAALLSFVSSFAISLRLAYLRWPSDTVVFRKLYAQQQKTKQA